MPISVQRGVAGRGIQGARAPARWTNFFHHFTAHGLKFHKIFEPWYIGENWLGTTSTCKATFAPKSPNSEIWAGGKGDMVEDVGSMVGFYGVAAREPTQKL